MIETHEYRQEHRYCIECGTPVIRFRDPDTDKVEATIHTDQTSEVSRACFLNLAAARRVLQLKRSV